jgi:hypothetical protein
VLLFFALMHAIAIKKAKIKCGALDRKVIKTDRITRNKYAGTFSMFMFKEKILRIPHIAAIAINKYDIIFGMKVY